MKPFIEAVNEGTVLISDGAWGTLLQARGLELGVCPELWNSTHREDVLAIAKSYIDAGSDIILTNSFGGSPFKLAHYDLKDKTSELNEAAAAISREAAGDDHYVLGSIGPTGVLLMMGEVSEEELAEGFALQAKALEKGGVDVICIETMSAVDEACCAIKAVKGVSDLPIVCTFTFEKTAAGDYKTMMGVSPAEMVEAVKGAGAQVIGTNCGNGIDGMVDIVKEIRAVEPDMPVLVHANAGKPVIENTVTTFPETPEIMAAKAGELIGAGANIIGGCCGTTPEHIKAMVAAVR